MPVVSGGDGHAARPAAPLSVLSPVPAETADTLASARLHCWTTVWSDDTGALRECRRCGANLREVYAGMHVHLAEPVPDAYCR